MLIIQLHLRPISACTDWVVSAAYELVQCAVTVMLL